MEAIVKKLLIASLTILGLAGPAWAVFPQYGTLQVSTNTTYAPPIQNGSINVASGTVKVITSTDDKPRYLTVGSTASIAGATTINSSLTVTGNLGVSGNINAPVTATSSSTFKSNVEVDGVFLATGSVTLGSAGNAVAISSNEFVGNTTFYARGSNYSIVTDTAAIQQLYNQIMRYRRPRLVYVNGNEVDIESGTVGGVTAYGSSITVVFHDGAVYTSTGTEASQAVITSTANWGNPLSGGLRLGEKLTGNTWENYYMVKSTAPGDTTHMVVAISSWTPIQANYAQLNTNFCGSGGSFCWVYLGAAAYGDNSTAPNAILAFKQSGAKTVFTNNGNCGFRSIPGVCIANSNGATSLTWSYATGVSVSSQTTPTMLMGTFTNTQETGGSEVFITDSTGNLAYQAISATLGLTEVSTPDVDLTRGVRNLSGNSVKQGISLSSFIDSVLGGNSQL